MRYAPSEASEHSAASVFCPPLSGLMYQVSAAAPPVSSSELQAPRTDTATARAAMAHGRRTERNDPDNETPLDVTSITSREVAVVNDLA